MAAVVETGGGASGSLSRWNSDLRPAAKPEAPDWAAGACFGAVAAPSFGNGAGIGSGMVSAVAAVSSTMLSGAAPTSSPGLVPAIVPSLSRPCLNSLAAPCGEITTNSRQAQLTSPLRDSQ